MPYCGGRWAEMKLQELGVLFGVWWWWSPVLWKPGHLSVNVWQFAVVPPPSLFLLSFLPVCFLLILPAQFQCSGYEDVQVEKPFFLLDRKGLQGVIVYRLRNGRSGGRGLRFWGMKKWRDGGRNCSGWLRRKWRGGRCGEERGKGIGGRCNRRTWALSVLIIFCWWLSHNFCVVADWSWEVGRGERESGRGGWMWLQRRTGTGRV